MKGKNHSKIMISAILAVVVVCAGTAVGISVWNHNLSTDAQTAVTPQPGISGEAQKEKAYEDVYFTPALASFSHEDLKKLSHLVIRGTVTGISEPFSIKGVGSSRGSNFTEYYVTPTQVLRGDAELEQEISVRVEGGAAGRYNVTSDVDPTFSIGDECLLFLYQPNSGGGINTEGDYYWIVGRIQGAYLRTENSPEDAPVYHGMEKAGGNISFPDFAAEMEEANEEYPIDLDWLRRQSTEALENNLENEMITQEEYDQWLAELDEYATIVTDGGQIIRKGERPTPAANDSESSREETHLLG